MNRDHDELIAEGKIAAARYAEQPLAERNGHRREHCSDEPPDTDEYVVGEWNGHLDEPDHRGDPGDEDRDVYANAVRVRAAQIRLERDARALIDAESLPPVEYPPVTSLTELLNEPDEAANYRIDQVAPKQGNIILAAQFKAGKTTTVNNLVRSLVDSDPFLGRFTVHQPAEHLVLIDNEMGRNTMRRWMRDQNIRNTKAVADVITLRGRLSTFNILDDKIRDQWATRLRDIGCDYLMFDCLRPILDALALDENRDVGKFLVHFDALLVVCPAFS